MSKTFIDSLGRTYATVVSGDNHLGAESKFPFVINGDVDVNAKGAAYATYEGTALQTMPATPHDVVGRLGRNNRSSQQFDVYGRPTVSIAADGTMSKIVYGLDSADSYDHLDMSDDPLHNGTYSTQRVDGLGRAVLSISRYRSTADSNGTIIEKWSVPTFDALGDVTVATQFERAAGTGADFNKIARRAKYDSLGRLRYNTAVTFGTWEYQYNHLGQMNYARNELGDEFRYEYDQIGRVISESSHHHNADPNAWTMDAAYFYDEYPNSSVGNAGLLAPLESLTGINDVSYPEYAVMRGKLVAKWDASGISMVVSDRGLRGESWRMVFPDMTQVYHSESVSDYAGQLVYAEDSNGVNGVRTTASYYDDGTAKSSFVSYNVGGTRIAKPITIVKKSYTNILGQTELVQYGDAGNTVAWNGYDPVMHRRRATVVQNNTGTLMAFGYHYNQIGLLEAIGDFRGRSAYNANSVAPHPADISHSAVGYHFPSMASANEYALDSAMTAPTLFANNSTQTSWPIGAAPSDVVFTYDSRYQLIAEDRDYITGTTANGDDWADASDVNSKRLRSAHWEFDTRGNMTSWTEEGDGTGISTKNLGRALGGTIKNGWQLNHEANNEACMFALEDPNAAFPGNCKIPDAVYFATNIGDEGLTSGKGTCIWANYDAMGRMTSQTVRTGCTSCTYSGGPNGAQCFDGEATRTNYTYTWDVRSRLIGAEKVTSGSSSENIVMSYLYDIGGNRVVREKSNVSGGAMYDIYQDVYLGSIERRHVQLRDQWSNARSISTNVQGGEVVSFQNVEDTRELRYAAGARLEYDNGDGDGISNNAPKIFLSFDNHLGSTSTVIDYETGELVEWNTHYAYGADESRWKNPDSKYANAEDPYGFTGKEEDKAVGLHYFGARYYSSYLGRWLSPDPPVVHGGGFSNHYNYGGNSPYIYVDPDGNWIHIVVGAVVGAIVGGVTGAIKGIKEHNFRKAVVGNIVGSIVGAASGAAIAATGGAAAGAASGLGAASTFTSATGLATATGLAGTAGAAATAAYAVASAGAAAAWSFAQTAITTKGDFQKAGISAAISFGSSLVGSAVGSAAGGLGKFGRAAASYMSSVATSYGAAALTSGVNEENWDDILLDASISSVAGIAASATVGDAISKSAGMGGSPRIGGAVGSAGDEAGYRTRGSGCTPVISSQGDTALYAPGSESMYGRAERWLTTEHRNLNASEKQFLKRYFGKSLDVNSIKIGYSPGERSWSPRDNVIELSSDMFRNGDMSQGVDFGDNYVSSVFAHEATHVWQRQHGEWVTLKGIGLQGRYLAGEDVYAYDETITNPQQMLKMFKYSNLEQQGKMVQDYVYANRVGRSTNKFSEIAKYLKNR